MIIWYDYNDFAKFMFNTWANIENYSILLPALFQLFKQSLGGYINLKHLDKFAEVIIYS